MASFWIGPMSIEPPALNPRPSLNIFSKAGGSRFET